MLFAIDHLVNKYLPDACISLDTETSVVYANEENISTRERDVSPQ